MADNLTQIAETFENLNVTFQEVNATDILNTAIQAGNSDTNGMLGLFVLAIISFSVLIFIIKYENSFRINERTTLIMAVLSVVLDLGLFLFSFRIVEDLQTIIFIFTAFTVVGMFSLLKKEIQSPDT